MFTKFSTVALVGNVILAKLVPDRSLYTAKKCTLISKDSPYRISTCIDICLIILNNNDIRLGEFIRVDTFIVKNGYDHDGRSQFLYVLIICESGFQIKIHKFNEIFIYISNYTGALVYKTCVQLYSCSTSVKSSDYIISRKNSTTGVD